MPVHQRAFDDVDRAVGGLARLLRIVHDVGVDALDEGVLEPLGDRPAAPFGLGLLAHRIAAAVALGELDQPLGGIVAPVEDDVLARFPEVGIDRVVDVELAGIDDRHVEAGRDCVEQEDRMHRPADRLVAAEGE
jgi:hypothetical protein